MDTIAATAKTAQPKGTTMTQWTRDDLPEVPALRQADDERGTGNRATAFDIALDVVVEHLNRAHPKPSGDLYSMVLSQAGHVHDLKADLADLQRERDAAVERAEAAEARIEGWREAHDALMENPCPVTLDEFEKSIDRWKLTGQNRGATLADDLHALVSGDDPAVHVVRESNLPEVVTTFDGDIKAGDYTWTDPGDLRASDLREKRDEHAAQVAAYEAVARAIEAEQAVDPVEELAGQIETAAREAVRKVCVLTGAVVPGLDAGVVEEMLDIAAESRRLARHVLGQEADHA